MAEKYNFSMMKNPQIVLINLTVLSMIKVEKDKKSKHVPYLIVTILLRKTPRRKIAKHMKTRHENMIVLSHCLIICLVSGLRQLNNIFLSIDIVRWMNEGFLTCLCKIFLVCYLWFGHKRN